MTMFSESLKRFRDEKNISLVDIAERVGKSVSDVSRWFKGERTPESIESVKALILAMRLTENEGNELRRHYRVVKLGEDKCRDFDSVIRLIRKLQICRDEYRNNTYTTNWNGDLEGVDKPIIIQGKSKLIGMIKKVLAYTSDKLGEKLCIQTFGYEDEMNSLLKSYCSQNDTKSIEMMVMDTGNKSYSHSYIELLTNFAEILYKNNDLNIWLNDDSSVNDINQNNSIFTSHYLLCFSSDFSEGLFTTDKAFIKYNMEKFETLKSISSIILKKNEMAIERMKLEIETNIRNSKKCFEFQPCLGMSLKPEQIEKYIYKDIPNRNMLISTIKEAFIGFAQENSNETVVSYFSEEGLREFLDTGIFTAFPYPLYGGITLEDKISIVQDAIELTRKGQYQNYMIRNKGLDNLRGIHIEYSYGTTDYVVIDIDKGNRSLEQFVITNENIIKVFRNFFEIVEKSEVCYDLDETINRMQIVVDEYKSKLTDYD